MGGCLAKFKSESEEDRIKSMQKYHQHVCEIQEEILGCDKKLLEITNFYEGAEDEAQTHLSHEYLLMEDNRSKFSKLLLRIQQTRRNNQYLSLTSSISGTTDSETDSTKVLAILGKERQTERKIARISGRIADSVEGDLSSSLLATKERIQRRLKRDEKEPLISLSSSVSGRKKEEPVTLLTL